MQPEPCLRCDVHESTEWTCVCDGDCGHPLCVERHVTEHEEWRVTGEPGQDYPPYDFVWSTFRGTDHGHHPERSARGFIELVRDGPGWVDGPYLSRRTVTATEWAEVSD